MRNFMQPAVMLSPVKHERQRRFPLGEELKIRCWTALALGALWLLGKTTRKRYIGATELFARWQRGEQVILAFWHNRLLLMPFPYRGRKACIMNSSHRDGEIITRVIKRFGISAVRGSSTRGWMGGLKGMIEAYRQGHDLIVVPDGPRGPRYHAKPGALQLARATGAPIFPVTYGAAWKTTVRSWDRLLIPFPLSRVTYVVGQPILVSADASAEEMEEKRRELEASLLAITAQADGSFRTER
ncbi:MAG: lysophospholipid acyltransferase family protein [Deltaproteobacteria bacterium]|nr:lysophospholipid acyltransferase family protein [Deltaproteobacteria bacterium]